MFSQLKKNIFKVNLIVGPLLTIIVSIINFSVNYFLPKIGLISETEIVQFTEALLFSSSISSIYFLNRGNLNIKPSILNTVLFITILLLFSSRVGFFLLGLVVIFIYLDLYKYQGIYNEIKAKKSPFLLVSLSTLMVLILVTWRIQLIGLALLYISVLSICVYHLELPMVKISKANWINFDDFYYLSVVVVNQISVYFLLIRTSLSMEELEFLQYRSDMAFLTIGGLVGSVVLTILMRANFKGSFWIVLLSILSGIILYYFDIKQFYVPTLIGSSIYHGLNRIYIAPVKFFLLTIPTPLAVISISLQYIDNIFLGLAMVYALHMIISYTIHLNKGVSCQISDVR